MNCKRLMLLSLESGLSENSLEEVQNAVYRLAFKYLGLKEKYGEPQSQKEVLNAVREYLDLDDNQELAGRFKARLLLSTPGEVTELLVMPFKGVLGNTETNRGREGIIKTINEYPINEDEINQLVNFGKDFDDLGIIIVGHHGRDGFGAGTNTYFSQKVLAEWMNKFLDKGVHPRKMNITACVLDYPRGNINSFLEHVHFRPTGGTENRPHGLAAYDQIVFVRKDGTRKNNRKSFHSYSFEKQVWEEVDEHIYTDGRNNQKKPKDNEDVVARILGTDAVAQVKNVEVKNIKFLNPTDGVLSAVVGYVGATNLYVRDLETHESLSDHWKNYYRIKGEYLGEMNLGDVNVNDQLIILSSNEKITVERPNDDLPSDKLLEVIEKQLEVLKRQNKELQDLKQLPRAYKALDVFKRNNEEVQQLLEALPKTYKAVASLRKAIEQEQKRIQEFLDIHKDNPDEPLSELQGHTYMQRVAQSLSELNADRQSSIANLHVLDYQTPESDKFLDLLEQTQRFISEYKSVSGKELSEETIKRLNQLEMEIRSESNQLYILINASMQNPYWSMENPQHEERQEWQEKALRELRQSCELLSRSLRREKARIALEQQDKDILGLLHNLFRFKVVKDYDAYEKQMFDEINNVRAELAKELSRLDEHPRQQPNQPLPEIVQDHISSDHFKKEAEQVIVSLIHGEFVSLLVELKEYENRFREAISWLKDASVLRREIFNLNHAIDFAIRTAESYQDKTKIIDPILVKGNLTQRRMGIKSTILPLLERIEAQAQKHEPEELRGRRERIQLELEKEKKLVNEKLQQLANTANLATPELNTLNQDLIEHQKEIGNHLQTLQKPQQPGVLNNIEEYLYQQRTKSRFQIMRLKGELLLSPSMPEERQARLIQKLSQAQQILIAQIQHLQTQMPLLRRIGNADWTKLNITLEKAKTVFGYQLKKMQKEVMDNDALKAIQQLLTYHAAQQQNLYAPEIRRLAVEEQLMPRRDQVGANLQASIHSLDNDIHQLQNLINDSELLQSVYQPTEAQWQRERNALDRELRKVSQATDRDLRNMQALIDAEVAKRAQRQSVLRNIRNAKTKGWYSSSGGGDDNPPGPPPSGDGNGPDDSKKQKNTKSSQAGAKFFDRVMRMISQSSSSSSNQNKSKHATDNETALNMFSVACFMAGELPETDLEKLEHYDARPVAVGDKLGKVAEVLDRGKTYLVQLMSPDRHSIVGDGSLFVAVPAALYEAAGRINHNDSVQDQIKKVKSSAAFTVHKDLYTKMLAKINLNQPVPELANPMHQHSVRAH